MIYCLLSTKTCKWRKPIPQSINQHNHDIHRMNINLWHWILNLQINKHNQCGKQPQSVLTLAMYTPSSNTSVSKQIWSIFIAEKWKVLYIWIKLAKRRCGLQCQKWRCIDYLKAHSPDYYLLIIGWLRLRIDRHNKIILLFTFRIPIILTIVFSFDPWFFIYTTTWCFYCQNKLYAIGHQKPWFRGWLTRIFAKSL